jgi:hypothetical protein
MHRFAKKHNLFIISLLVIFILSLLGCATKDPASMIAPNTSASNQRADGELKILKRANPRLGKSFLKAGLVKPSTGGYIVVGDLWSGFSSLSFPPFAVNREVWVTFRWESENLLQGGAEFSPHGITFNRPARIRLSYKDADLQGINEDNIRIWYYNEDDGTWELIGGTVNKSGKCIEGYISHFSRYALAAE